MKIGLISDTHDHLENIRAAVRRFRERGVEQVLHAGDMCSPPAVKALEGLPLAGVLGNNDGELFGLLKGFNALEARLEQHLLEMELAGRSIGVYHGTVAAIRESLAASGRYHILVTGHTHRVERRLVGGTTLLNPGTAHGFGQPATVMVYDLESGESEVLELT